MPGARIVTAVTVLINTVIFYLGCSRMDRRIQVIAVRTTGFDTVIPISVHIGHIVSAAILINAVISNLLSTRIDARIIIITVITTTQDTKESIPVEITRRDLISRIFSVIVVVREFIIISIICPQDGHARIDKPVAV